MHHSKGGRERARESKCRKAATMKEWSEGEPVRQRTNKMYINESSKIHFAKHQTHCTLKHNFFLCAARINHCSLFFKLTCSESEMHHKIE